jgi:hypothetical protein
MSNLRCKPGDLAIVIKAECQTNLGRIVRVIKRSQGDGDLIYSSFEPTWWVESSHPMTWTKSKKRYRRKKGPVPDAQLQPIKALPLGRDVADGMWENHIESITLPMMNKKEKIC